MGGCKQTNKQKDNKRIGARNHYSFFNRDLIGCQSFTLLLHTRSLACVCLWVFVCVCVCVSDWAGVAISL